jgi:hypothetical protein
MIALITPTGGRQKQIELCYKWMRRQTYAGDVVWLIVDDCKPRTTDFIAEWDKWTVIHIQPHPLWEVGQNTQARNLQVALKVLQEKYSLTDIEAIFIIEDDDYYKPEYLTKMMEIKEDYDAWGESYTIYYNVKYRTHVTNENTWHPSLFQMAFKPSVIPIFESCYGDKFIDYVFFYKLVNKKVFNAGNLSIGIKGMDGRGGIGAGHERLKNMKTDHGLIYFKKLIGEDVELYF